MEDGAGPSSTRPHCAGKVDLPAAHFAVTAPQSTLTAVRFTLEDVGITVVSRWLFNCYVVADGGDGGALVVDPGLPSSSRDVIGNILRSSGRAGDDIAVVLATHTHADHVGGVPDLCAGAAPARFLLPGRAEAYVKGETPRTPGPRAMGRIWPLVLDQPADFAALAELARASRQIGFGTGPFRMPVEPDGYVDDGDRLGEASDWEVLHTPGHTDDSTCYYNARTKVLLSGDTVLTVGGRAWFNPEYCDPDLSRETEARLRDLHVDVLLPGHGRPIVGHNVLDDALCHRDRLPRRGRYMAASAVEQFRRRKPPVVVL